MIETPITELTLPQILDLAILYVIPLILGGIASKIADRTAETTPAETTPPAPFQNIKDPVAWGIMAVIVLVYPFTATIELAAGWTAVWSLAVVSGLGAQTLLMKKTRQLIDKQATGEPQ